MLKDFDFDKKDKTLSGTKRSELGRELAALQRKLVNSDSSMLIVVDGWESSGKGHILKDLTRELDPRYFEEAPLMMPWTISQSVLFCGVSHGIYPEKGGSLFLTGVSILNS